MDYFAAIEAEINEDENIKEIFRLLKEEVTNQVDEAIKYKKALKEALLKKRSEPILAPSTAKKYDDLPF